LSVCLQSLVLDKVHAEWSKDKRVEDVTIKVRGKKWEISCWRYDFLRFHSSFRTIFNRFKYVFNNCKFRTLHIHLIEDCKPSIIHELINYCTKLQCTDRMSINSSAKLLPKFMTGKCLRELMSNKKDVKLHLLCEEITAGELFAVWEDLLDGKFDGLSLTVNTSVVIELFDLIRTDGKKSIWKGGKVDPIEVESLKETVKRYEIWCDSEWGGVPIVEMSRIYEGRCWKSANYRDISDDSDSDSSE
ncbi:hypothetical protein PFISCL1PPCAC_21864, partial [Pristionchus fissidentatus]